MESERSTIAQNGTPGEPVLVPADRLSTSIKVISPNLSQPMTLLDIPVVLTVQQLKERIRQQLPSRPADNQQRLIYRGRMVNRPEEKLLDLFGEEQIRSSDQQSIHLIVPEVNDSPSTTPARGPSPISAPRAQDAINPAHQYFDTVLQQSSRQMGARRLANGGLPSTSHIAGQFPTGPQPTAGTPVADHNYQHLYSQQPHHMPQGSYPAAPQMFRGQPNPSQFQQSQLQQMSHRLNREAAMHRAYMNQLDRAGGMPSRRTPQPPVPSPVEVGQGRSSPAPGQGRTPDGPRPRSGGDNPDGGLSDAEVQSILRGADIRQAILAMTNAMQRSTSNTSMGPQSGRATPNSSSRPTSTGPGTRAPTGIPTPSSTHSQSSPQVYLICSPTGPRGLLINDAYSEHYFTPATRPTSTTPHPSTSPHPLTTPHLGLPNLPTYTPTATTQAGTPEHHNFAAEQPRRDQGGQGGDAQDGMRRRIRVGIDQGREAPDDIAGGHARPRRQAGAAAVIARVWPHFWLAVRLGLFVWWFTSPSSGWSRWAAVIGIAVAIFVLNTGIFDGFADVIWRAICRHMENLIPMVDPNRAPAPQAGQNQNQNQNRAAQPGAPQRDDPLQPASMARRVVGERRQANANRLLDRVRSVERASLLFLASIAPGVAERHIANLEAEMERQRREAEAEAAADEARRVAEEAERTGANPADASTGEAAAGEGGPGAAAGDARAENIPPPAPQAVPGDGAAA